MTTDLLETSALRHAGAASPDPDLVQAFVGRIVNDLGAAISGALVVVGDRLALYRVLARQPATPMELARSTGTAERYVREWLSAQAASGYVSYDKESERFYLTPEQAAVLADEESPSFMAGGFELVQSVWRDEPTITDAFQSGRGVGWHEHDVCLFRGTERFFKPGYKAQLVSSWIPALDGVEQKLVSGADVADAGCGRGASTILMAKAYPNSRFVGFDYHTPSIQRARDRASAEGVLNVEFRTAAAHEIPREGFDLITVFDALHDMGDPVGAARRIREALASDGTWLLVEPFANDDLADNLNPIGRLYYSASTMICTPASLSQEVGLALGAQAGEARLRRVVEEAGFTRFRRAAETPVNLVFEVRP
jgi:SAM-dependent methyltransferase